MGVDPLRGSLEMGKQGVSSPVVCSHSLRHDCLGTSVMSGLWVFAYGTFNLEASLQS